MQGAEGVSASAQDLEISPPKVLFELDPSLHPGILVAPDGEGFLAASLAALGGAGAGEIDEIDEIIVTLNFSKELERLVSDQNK